MATVIHEELIDHDGGLECGLGHSHVRLYVCVGNYNADAKTCGAGLCHHDVPRDYPAKSHIPGYSALQWLDFCRDDARRNAEIDAGLGKQVTQKDLLYQKALAAALSK